MEPIAKDMQVFIVFNVSFYSNKDENYIENPFKKSQLEKLFKLKEKVPQKWRSFEMDVRNEEQVAILFDTIANHIRREKARTKKGLLELGNTK